MLQELLARGIPFFGICFGNQLLGRALGFGTYKLEYGHRGINQPVQDRSTGKVEVTAHNHGFAVDAPLDGVSRDARTAAVEVSHVCLNDGVVEGLRLPRRRPAFCVQYHPEAAAGPHDAAYLFDRFVDLMGGPGLMPRRDDIESRPGHRLRPDRHRPGRASSTTPAPRPAGCCAAEGLRVILVNSNPATIMTDPEFADATYVEPITPEFVEKIIAKERPDALLPTLGGQTALNTAIALHENGRPGEVRRRADRRQRRGHPEGRGPRAVQGRRRAVRRRVGAQPVICHTMDECVAGVAELGGYPVVVRPSFTMGGAGSGFAHDEDELRRIAGAGLHALADHRGAPGGVHPRLEGVRAGADARQATTTWWSSARSRTSTRWACTPATRSRSRPR